MQEQSTLMSATISLEIVNKKGTFALRVWAPKITCGYIHQATWWEEVLQAKEWVEHIGFLKYVLMHPHLYDMSLFRAIQGKSWLAWHTSLLRTCLVHLVTFSILLGLFKWFNFIRLIHENQMNLMIIWYHYCFYAWLDLVVSYDMFVGLWTYWSRKRAISV